MNESVIEISKKVSYVSSKQRFTEFDDFNKGKL